MGGNKRLFSLLVAQAIAAMLLICAHFSTFLHQLTEYKAASCTGTAVTHPTLTSRCYTYHSNTTAENTCCKTLNFSNSIQLLHRCIRRRAEEHLAGERGPNVTWALYGDSHFRFLFATLLTRFLAPSLKTRLLRQNSWQNATILEDYLRHTQLWQSMEARDFSTGFGFTFYWDPYLTKVFPKHLRGWSNNSSKPPDLIVAGSAIWWMGEKKHIYKTKGAAAVVKDYYTHLHSLRRSLTRLTNQTTIIFKLLDDLKRTRTGDTQDPQNNRQNHELYNKEAMRALQGTGVLVWNSTLPMSTLYVDACVRYNYTTPPRNLWKCTDKMHVGYIVVEQYADMLLNLFCNKHLDLDPCHCH